MALKVVVFFQNGPLPRTLNWDLHRNLNCKSERVLSAIGK